MDEPAAVSAPDSASPPRTWVRWRVVAWLCSIAVIAYVQRYTIAVTKEPMAADLGIDPQDLGTILSAFFLGYAAFQIPGGLIRDLWGTRATLAVAALGATITTALMSLVDGESTATYAWFATGAFQAALFPCAVSAIRNWLPATERATASGMLAACMSLGGAAATYFAGDLLQVTNWRGTFAWIAVPGIIWAVGFAICYRSRPQWHSGVNAAELNWIRGGSTDDALPSNGDQQLGPTPWGAILLTPVLLMLYLQQFLRAGGQVFFGTWFTTYLQQARSVELARSGVLTSLPQLALMAGSLLGGWLSDRLLRRSGSHWLAYQLVAIVSLILCAALIGSSYFVTDATAAVLVISLGMFCGAMGGPAAYAVSIAKGGRHVASVFAMMNMSGNIGAMLLPVVLPSLVVAWGWDGVLFGFAGVFAAAAICWCFVSARGSVDDFTEDSTAHA